MKKERIFYTFDRTCYALLKHLHFDVKIQKGLKKGTFFDL